MDKKEKMKIICAIAETNYKKMNPNLNTFELFPSNWSSIDDDYIKTKIIMEALKNNTTIKETSLYQEINNSIKVK